MASQTKLMRPKKAVDKDPIRIPDDPMTTIESRWGKSTEYENIRLALKYAEALNVSADINTVIQQFKARKTSKLVARVSVDAVGECSISDSVLRSNYVGMIVDYMEASRKLEICVKRINASIMTAEYDWMEKAFKTQHARAAAVEGLVAEAIDRGKELQLAIDILRELIADIDQTQKTLKVANDGLMMEFRHEKVYGR